jgi:hypothetical protein
MWQYGRGWLPFAYYKRGNNTLWDSPFSDWEYVDGRALDPGRISALG